MATTPTRRHVTQQAAAMEDQVPDRGALTACVIAAAFGIAWTLWGASGLPAVAQGAVRGTGIVVGVLIIIRSVRLRRAAPLARESLVRSPSYRGVVAAEAIAIVGGDAALAASGHLEYVAAWVAGVVGIHFLAFGRLISTFYYPVGIAVTIAGIAGAAVGASGGGRGGIEATSGLIAAITLLAGSGYRAFSTARPARLSPSHTSQQPGS